MVFRRWNKENICLVSNLFSVHRIWGLLAFFPRYFYIYIYTYFFDKGSFFTLLGVDKCGVLIGTFSGFEWFSYVCVAFVCLKALSFCSVSEAVDFSFFFRKKIQACLGFFVVILGFFVIEFSIFCQWMLGLIFASLGL